MRHEGTFFHLEDYAAWFQTLYCMPGITRDIHPKATFGRTEFDALCDLSEVVVNVQTYFATQHDKRLVFRDMVMDGNYGTYFPRIEEAVALLVEALMKVVIHA